MGDDVSELDGDELVNEWADAWHKINQGTISDDERERLEDRRGELWREMKERTDAEPPECPECGGSQWSQNPGEPKHCTECDFHPGMEDMELIGEIDDYWMKVQASPRTA